MFNPIIETAIGFVFVYLLLSMVCSALQEWIATLLALRSRTLFEGITEMLCGDSVLRDKIYNHALVKGLSRKTWLDKRAGRDSRPSYIAPETFSKTFLAVTQDVTKLADNSKELLAGLALAAEPDIEARRKSVEQWYKDAMDRVSGWYKRKTQGILLVLGLVVAIVFNADSLMLARAFWVDPTLRARTVAAAQEFVRTHPNGVGATTTPSGETRSGSDTAKKAGNNAVSEGKKGSGKGATATPKSTPKNTEKTGGAADKNPGGASTDIASNYPSTTDTTPAPPPPDEPEYTQQQTDRAEQQYRAAAANVEETTAGAWSQLTALKVPIGWCSDNADSGRTLEQIVSEPENEGEAGDDTGLPCTPERQLPRTGSAWFLKISGLLITMIALSQGAPFWFDMLKKIVNLRLAGDAPDEKKK